MDFFAEADEKAPKFETRIFVKHLTKQTMNCQMKIVPIKNTQNVILIGLGKELHSLEAEMINNSNKSIQKSSSISVNQKKFL